VPGVIKPRGGEGDIPRQLLLRPQNLENLDGSGWQVSKKPVDGAHMLNTRGEGDKIVVPIPVRIQIWKFPRNPILPHLLQGIDLGCREVLYRKKEKHKHETPERVCRKKHVGKSKEQR
jgi:hypothetical protein